MSKRARMLLQAWVAAGALAAGTAAADVYTWVDAGGKVNVSNLAPPAGARVTAVARESTTAAERAEAARKAAQDAEVRALSDRVAELESAVQDARAGPPPVYMAPQPPPPAPQFVVTMMPQGADDAPLAPGYACAWAGCPLPLGAAFYGTPVVVVAPGFNRRDRSGRRPHVVVPTPHAIVGAPAPRMTRRS